MAWTDSHSRDKAFIPVQWWVSSFCCVVQFYWPVISWGRDGIITGQAFLICLAGLRIQFIQMAELTLLFLMIFVNVKCVDYWNVEPWEELRHIFGIGNDQKNKVNVNLTKIVNDYENIPTSDSSSNMLYLYLGSSVSSTWWSIRCWSEQHLYEASIPSLLQGWSLAELVDLDFFCLLSEIFVIRIKIFQNTLARLCLIGDWCYWYKEWQIGEFVLCLIPW